MSYTDFKYMSHKGVIFWSGVIIYYERTCGIIPEIE